MYTVLADSFNKGESLFREMMHVTVPGTVPVLSIVLCIIACVLFIS